MKRFGISEGGGDTKIGHHVTFPERLNVPPPFMCLDEQQSENFLDYALYAVIVHVRASIQMGDFVA